MWLSNPTVALIYGIKHHLGCIWWPHSFFPCAEGLRATPSCLVAWPREVPCSCKLRQGSLAPRTILLLLQKSCVHHGQGCPDQRSYSFAFSHTGGSCPAATLLTAVQALLAFLPCFLRVSLGLPTCVLLQHSPGNLLCFLPSPTPCVNIGVCWCTCLCDGDTWRLEDFWLWSSGPILDTFCCCAETL